METVVGVIPCLACCFCSSYRLGRNSCNWSRKVMHSPLEVLQHKPYQVLCQLTSESHTTFNILFHSTLLLWDVMASLSNRDRYYGNLCYSLLLFIICNMDPGSFGIWEHTFVNHNADNQHSHKGRIGSKHVRKVFEVNMFPDQWSWKSMPDNPWKRYCVSQWPREGHL